VSIKFQVFCDVNPSRLVQSTDVPEERIISISSAYRSKEAGLLDSGNEAQSPCERSVALYQSILGKVQRLRRLYFAYLPCQCG
jgi:hypothetical protein